MCIKAFSEANFSSYFFFLHVFSFQTYLYFSNIYQPIYDIAEIYRFCLSIDLL